VIKKTFFKLKKQGGFNEKKNIFFHGPSIIVFAIYTHRPDHTG
jgi:hypothetical protein